MRVLIAGVAAGLLSCSPPIPNDCPTELPLPADFYGYADETEPVGTTKTFRFDGRVEKACVRVNVTKPTGSLVVDASLEATVTLDEPGRYTATLSLRSTDAGRTTTKVVIAVAEPTANPPCAILARACLRVGRSGALFACDEALFHTDGGLVATLDGGAWFARGDALFAWADGELRLVGADGTTVASTPWAERPSLWSANQRQLAVWSGDAGAHFSVNGLSMLGDFSSAHPLVAIAVQPNDEVLRISNSPERIACPLVGACARAENALSTSVYAANESTVWLQMTEPNFSSKYWRFEQTGGVWNRQAQTANSFVRGSNVNRRPLMKSAWGARVDGQTSGDTRFDGFTSGGASDELVWLTDGVTTRVWCE